MASSPLTSSADVLRWDLLESQPPSGERLTVRVARPSYRSDVLIAVDAKLRRYVLVAIPEGEPFEIVERTSRGIAVQTVEMNTEVDSVANFIEIECIEPQGHAALDIVITELIDALDAGASIGRVRLVQNVLAKWRRFWSGTNSANLSREQQLGLFGELWFLTRWLLPNIDGSKAVQMWRGPMGARNDFETPRLSIEVKTTSRIDSAFVIHGLDQLLEPSGGALCLFGLVVREEASATDSLPRLVEEARNLLSANLDELSQLDSQLYAAGFDDRHASDYSKMTLRVRSEELYRIGEGFPRLIPSSLVGGIPSGVDSIEYQLRLDAAGDFRLASNPKAASALLADFLK